VLEDNKNSKKVKVEERKKERERGKERGKKEQVYVDRGRMSKMFWH
jgi:hypothetical protein